MKNIPITKPSITELEVNYVNDAIKNGWGSNCYNYILQFQEKFSKYLGSQYALATSSCTGAIHLALLALDLKPGDEVLITESTWIASVEPILYIGAKPIFIDIDKKTWCIDAEKLEKSITSKTKGILAVHLYGNICEMDDIMALAKKHSLWVLEDSAEALGSEYKGKKCGSIGDVGVFSFHGTKTMTTGEGGIITTNREDIFKRCSVLNDHGRDPDNSEGKYFWMKEYGYKYKMSNLQASLGCAQIERVDDLINKKIKIFEWYKSQFEKYDFIDMNFTQKGCKNSYWMPTVVVDEKINFNRDILINQMNNKGINVRPFFYPLSSLTFFSKEISNQNAYSISKRALNLPSFHDITNEDVIFVCDTFLELFNC